MNKRIEKLKETVGSGVYRICSEKNRLITESFRETERQPEVLRNAKALAHVLDNFPLFIGDGELIVGNPASKPRGIEFTNLYGVWTDQEIDWAKEDSGLVISEEDVQQLKEDKEYWEGKTFISRLTDFFHEESIGPFMQTGALLPIWKKGDRNWGGGIAGAGFGIIVEHGSIGFVPDYAKVLNQGLNGIIEEARRELKALRLVSNEAIEKYDFLRAVIIAHEAIIRYAERMGRFASELSAKESDPVRKKELADIAEVCHWAPANPVRTFREAIQSFWFIFMVLNPNNIIGYGRFDQYMYPFYKKDVEAKKITDEEVLELLECLRIKDMELIMMGGKGNRQKWSGFAKWHNMIIGGQTRDGKDATNPLTFLVLEAAGDCRTPHHTVTLRVHEDTPDDLMVKAAEVVSKGMGMPAFIGDKGCIATLQNYGISLEESRNFVLAGCLNVAVSGGSRFVSDPMFIIPKVFDIFMHNGVDPKTDMQVGPRTGNLEDFQSFEELMAAWKEQLGYFMGVLSEYHNIWIRAYEELYPMPVESSLMIDGVKEGKSLMKRKQPFENGAVTNAVGMINVADSLAAVKKLVFDEKKVTMKELKTALAANWQGNGYAEMRKLFVQAPKFGNDNDYVDSIARDLYQFWADKALSFTTIIGGKNIPGAISISAQWPGGEETGPTPDGRYDGECLADGTTSAMRGMDLNGPTAMIKSAGKIDQIPLESTLMNMKFHPGSLKTREDLLKLGHLIKTYFSLDGKHMQFNVVSRGTLREAQKAPERHGDLIVRVAGYSAYFVQLNKGVQEEIALRTEQDLSK
jgi:pyruvate formate-lyase/glycerol dehydratase family glycyl radical enzyme